MRVLLLLCFFITSILFSQDEKRLALVIGNSNYDSIAKLANPVNDAKLIARTLDSLDFEVILATDLDKNDFMSKVVEFGKKRADYDVGFVYYAGHGVQINGENYLLPTNQNFDEEWKVEEYAINVNRINLLEESLMDQDNDTLDVIRNDVAGVSSDIDKVNKNSIDRDKEISNENKTLSTDVYKEFGKTRDLIGELSKLITILQKENELQTIMIEELKASNNPLGG